MFQIIILKMIPLLLELIFQRENGFLDRVKTSKENEDKLTKIATEYFEKIRK